MTTGYATATATRVFAVVALRQSDAVTLLDPPATRLVTTSGLVTLVHGDIERSLHPQWLRERSTEPGQIDPTNRQRLFTPLDLPTDLAIVDARLDGETIDVSFSDGHRAQLAVGPILRDLGLVPDTEAPPAAEPWTTPLPEFPYVDWAGIGWSDTDADPAAVVDFLGAFYRHGYVVLRHTPVEEGTVARIANRIGYLVGQNFGDVFDVRAEPSPTDLAYTAIELLAHTDEPYRRPPPGIQLLHCLANEAPGGDSTLVDGLAAAIALQADAPRLFLAAVEVEVEFRYDMGTDTVVNTGHLLEYDRHGRYRGIRFNTKIDNPLPRPGDDLDDWYAARRWLAEWLNDPAHQVTFRLEPGDTMFMDNHRALHGRTAFDPTRGRRHLQGCYIEHDGADTMYRLAVRRLAR
jgi:gamma-butyrobetaine dioxygenase